MLRDRVGEHLSISEIIDHILINPPHPLSMHNGDNINNNRIDWDKPTQAFSSIHIKM